MRRERFSAGTGKVHILEHPDDWARLAPRLRRVVAPSVRDAWRAFPTSFEERARRARHPGLRRWLTACSRGSCRLRVYDTRDFGRTALLEVSNGGALLDFRTAETRTKAFPPSAPKAEPSPRIPAALAEVYRAVGGIRSELGCSGSLVPPDALRLLPKCWGYDDDTPDFKCDQPTDEERRENADRGVSDLREWIKGGASGLDVSFVTEEFLEQVRAQAALPRPEIDTTSLRLDNWLAESPGGMTYARARRMVPFFEDSGDFLCFDGRGRATWIGWETGGVMEMGTVSDALDAFFDSLIAGTRFTHTFEPSA